MLSQTTRALILPEKRAPTTRDSAFWEPALDNPILLGNEQEKTTTSSMSM